MSYDLKAKNARMKLETAANKLQQAAKLAEIQGMIRLAGGDPTLWDFAAGTPVINLSNAQTGSAASTNKVTLTKDFVNCNFAVRIATTAGATPTCTYAIQGANDAAFATPISLYYSDSATPDTFVNTTFVITTTTTKVLLIKPNQAFRYIRLNYTANTNVTNTADVLAFGDF